MKKYIRQVLDDLAAKQKAEAAARQPVAEDLNNQQLSDDPAERLRQLDYQAQKSEERQNS